MKSGEKPQPAGVEELEELRKELIKLKKLHASTSNRLDILSAEIPDIVMEVDGDKVYTWANDAGFNFFGDDVIGKEAADYFEGGQDTYNSVKPLFNGKQGDTIYVESWQRRRDGEKRLLAWWCRPLKDKDGNVSGALSTARDITDYRRLEEREIFATRIFSQLPSKASYRETIKLMVSELKEFTGLEAVGIRIKNKGDYPYFETMGFSDYFVETERFICAYAEGGDILKDENGEPVLECMCGTVIRGKCDSSLPFFTEGGSFWTNSTTDLLAASTEEDRQGGRRNRCNEEGYESVALIPLKAGDSIIGLLQFNDHRRDCFTEDLVEYFERIASSLGSAIARVLAEEELEEANEKLRQVVEELKESQEQLVKKERLSAVGRMASGIAHDFNNTLMPILSLSDLLVQEPTLLEDKEETMTMLEQIYGAAKDARHIIQNMRLMYKSDDKAAVHKPVDINDVVAIALGLVEASWRKRTHARTRISSRVDLGVVPKIMGSDVELREALMNLIFNAADAMPDGGILSVSTYVSHGFVVLEIKDTGVGMTKDEQARCLEAFYTTKGSKGTGIGLSMVNGIVTAHKGKLDIKSRRGKGTTVTMRFPVCDEDVTEKISESEEKEPVKGKKILTVDDDNRSREIINGLLSVDGHSVTSFSNSTEAIAALDKESYDLVVTDLMMPGVDGYAVARAVKEHNAKLPVILVTGVGDQVFEHEASVSGIDIILTKPVTKDDLQGVISQVLSV